MTTANYLVTVMVALLSGTGGWGTLQFLLNRSGRKAEAARLQAEAEKLASSRAVLLADAQAMAQRTALDSANAAYGQVRQECADCRAELRLVRGATEALIDAIEEIAVELSDGGKVRLRQAVRVARQAL